MKTTKKAVFDFIESQESTYFVFVDIPDITDEVELREILISGEHLIIDGIIGRKRSVEHHSSSKIVFSDGSNLYKTDKVDGDYTFTTDRLTYYVREICFECDGEIRHKFLCYGANKEESK